jgi:GNAT superfamily N-acetyltransferase
MPTHERGTILRLLQESYQALPGLPRSLIEQWEPDWQQYDNDIFACPDTVGACGFVTTCDGTMVGFASWDPRQRPTLVVGHNCILPAFRGNGFGVRQMEELLARAQANGFTRAIVSTGDHLAFLPAQRMYLATGFHETRRFTIEDGWRMVEYEQTLPRPNRTQRGR